MVTEPIFRMVSLPVRPVNIPQSVWGRIGRNLHLNPSHPVGIVSGLIQSFFRDLHGDELVTFQLPATPIVTSGMAFDQLLVPKDHPLRSASDTYYVGSSSDEVLRPHATSHQGDVLAQLRNLPMARSSTVWTCDVYRKDEVDRIHFPVFHQTDGVRVFDRSVSEAEVVADLKASLEGLMESLFQNAERRWDPSAFFPFTNPSFEMEIRMPPSFPWIECLGCGKIRTEIDPNGWAFGIGIDRLAMLLFQIEDIRTLWSEDARFLSQFQPGKISAFKPFSKYPPAYRDTAFLLQPGQALDAKNFATACINLAGPYGLESVELRDTFASPDGRVSRCFRFTYRGIESTLTSQQCNEIHGSVVNRFIAEELGASIR